MPHLYRGQYLECYKPSLTWAPKLKMIPQKGVRKGRFILINEFRTEDDKRSRRSKNTNDLMFLKRQLDLTEADYPCCAAESFYRTNKLGILRSRIAFLEKSK